MMWSKRSNDEELSILDISSKTAFPYTLVYLRNEDEVLLLKKPPDKWGNPERWLGLGGKVEPGEDLSSAAIREAEEESGLAVSSVTLRGTLTYTVQEPVHENRAGTLYIFVTSEYDGDLLKESPEGVLQWHRISELPSLTDLASHQNFYLHRMLNDDSYFYCGIAAYDSGMEPIQYADSDRYFAERSAQSHK